MTFPPIAAQHSPNLPESPVVGPAANFTDADRLLAIVAMMRPVIAQLSGNDLRIASTALNWLPEYASSSPGHIELAFPLTTRKELNIVIQWGFDQKTGPRWKNPDVEEMNEILSARRESADPFATPLIVPSWPIAWQTVCQLIQEVGPKSISFEYY